MANLSIRSKLVLPMLGLLISVALSSLPGGALAAPPDSPPSPLPPLSPEPCTFEGDDPYEKRIYKLEGWKGPDFERYPGICKRLNLAHGPIVVEPGKNNVLIEPVATHAPSLNGYVTRFEPNLVLADGTVPPVEIVHLHHGTWLSDNAIYGEGAGGAFGDLGPIAAAGEEKTIFSSPPGYGVPVEATDVWYLLYMVHSAVQKPMTAYITYDIDFIPQKDVEGLGLKPIYPVWLDVRPSAYPVFNVQREYGDRQGTCTWPAEQCADFDPFGRSLTGQGMAGNGVGSDLTLPERGEPAGPIESFTGGTLIALGGHVHPGGLTDEIDLVRDGKSRRILTSEAIYWDRKDSSKPGGPPTSWDMSMTLASLPYWGVRVKPGDTLRINSTADTRRASTYETMGIAVGTIAPHDAEGKPTAPGVDPFRAPIDRSRECRSLRARISGPARQLTGIGLGAKRPSLCPKAVPTHGHQAANGNFGGARGHWTAEPGLPTRNVGITNFQYMPGDLSTVGTTGVPQVELGTNLRFINNEAAAVLHTITTCKFPCLGPTGAAFPLPDGESSTGRRVDLDSSQVGFGVPAITGAKNTPEWSTPITREAGYTPGETVTYFCRIHPSMRGAFQVTDAE